MSLTEKEVRKIAKLSRIGLDNQDLINYTEKLSSIVDLITQLDEVNTDEILPLISVSDFSLKMREDLAKSDNGVDEILSNAPKKNFNCFEVPKVVE